MAPSSRHGASASVELRRRAQESVRGWVTSASAGGGADRKWAAPLAATAAVTAAACAPVVWPLLGAGNGATAAVVGTALGQLGGVSGNLLAEAVVRAWDKLRSRGQADLRDALSAELQAGLTSPEAAALRDEVAGLLRSVQAIKVALTATVEKSAAGVTELLVRDLRRLGEEFVEFGWVLDEVNQQLTAIAEDVAQTAAISRELIDNQQQTLVELAMLRQEANSVRRNRASRPGPALRLACQRMRSGPAR
jgi:hypothetical protein